MHICTHTHTHTHTHILRAIESVDPGSHNEGVIERYTDMPNTQTSSLDFLHVYFIHSTAPNTHPALT